MNIAEIVSSWQSINQSILQIFNHKNAQKYDIANKTDSIIYMYIPSDLSQSNDDGIIQSVIELTSTPTTVPVGNNTCK